MEKLLEEGNIKMENVFGCLGCDENLSKYNCISREENDTYSIRSLENKKNYYTSDKIGIK